MLVSVDEARFGDEVRGALGKIQKGVFMQEENVRRNARMMAEAGMKEAALEMLKAFTEQVANDVMGMLKNLSDRIAMAIGMMGGLYGTRKEFLEAYCERVGMPLCGDCSGYSDDAARAWRNR